jgi:hypothetical protein
VELSLFFLDIDEGLLDTSNEYDTHIELLSPLNEPDGPPDGLDNPPQPLGNVPSIVERFD